MSSCRAVAVAAGPGAWPGGRGWIGAPALEFEDFGAFVHHALKAHGQPSPRISACSRVTTIHATLEAITKSGRQVALVTDADDRLLGIATDGDIRKALLRGASLDVVVGESTNAAPITGRAGLGRAAAGELMRARRIRHLPLVDAAGRLTDVVFLDDLLARVPLPAAAVIMAGGMGTRLRPLTEETPKPLLRVGGRPLIEILIERLERSGIGRVVVAVHHKSDMIREALGDGSRLGVRLSYVDEPERLGTIGALTLIRPRPAEPFFVINADILTKCDFRAMWEFHRAEGARMTAGVSLHQVDPRPLSPNHCLPGSAAGESPQSMLEVTTMSGDDRAGRRHRTGTPWKDQPIMDRRFESRPDVVDWQDALELRTCRPG